MKTYAKGSMRKFSMGYIGKEIERLGYIPTVYRYLPFIEFETFDFVNIFAAVDIDVCFTEIYASVLHL